MLLVTKDLKSYGYEAKLEMRSGDTRHHIPPDYYPERNLYHNFTYEENRKNDSFWRTPCMWTLACVVCLLVVALAIFLIIFFTWGPVFSVKYNVENVEKESTNFRKAFLETDPNEIAVPPSNANSTIKIIHPKIIDIDQKYTTVLHFDLDLPSFVLNALKTGEPKICILDTSYALTASGESPTKSNYETYLKEHLPFAKFFDINKVVKYTDNGVAQLTHPLQFQDYCRSGVLFGSVGALIWASLAVEYPPSCDSP
uniref:Uncharacterized protein n=1 Tax=Romanomermis culicivorax TaxID=13658 RepID=A0A915JAK2_ROMCU